MKRSLSTIMAVLAAGSLAVCAVSTPGSMAGAQAAGKTGGEAATSGEFRQLTTEVKVDGDLPKPFDSGDLEHLTLPPVPDEMAQLGSDLTEAFRNDPSFASVEITLDRKQLIVHWFGPPSDDLLAHLQHAPTVSTVIKPTKYSPGDLREAAQELLREPSVKVVEVAYDASRLTVRIDPAIEPGSAKLTGPSLTAAKGFPVIVEFGSVEATSASRQYDPSYRLGGARIYLFNDPFIGGSCTSGFTVVKTNDSSQHGTMFAAHCGSLGSQWIVSDGILASPWGPVIARTTAYDGGIINSGSLNPYIWVSTWDSAVYTGINGSALPLVGMEICYSGSYSGLVCGNIVQEINSHYNLGGDLTYVTGFETLQSAGIPAAGHGDSGGPGYQITSTSNGYIRRAVGIISAIPTDSTTTCSGVPGSANRLCSPTVYSTSAVQIASATGWSIATTP